MIFSPAGNNLPISFCIMFLKPRSEMFNGIFCKKVGIQSFQGKKTTKIKEGFQDRNVGLAKDIIDSSQNCFIWEYVDKDYINTQFSKSEKPDNKSVRYTFKHLLPILKLSSEGRI